MEYQNNENEIQKWTSFRSMLLYYGGEIDIDNTGMRSDLLPETPVIWMVSKKNPFKKKNTKNLTFCFIYLIN